MKEPADQEKTKRGFLAKLIDKLDKKMQEKAKSKSCCGSQEKSGEKSCCS